MIASDHISELAAAPPDVLTDSSWHSNEWSDCCSGRRLTAIVYFYTFLTFLNVFLFFFLRRFLHLGFTKGQHRRGQRRYRLCCLRTDTFVG